MRFGFVRLMKKDNGEKKNGNKIKSNLAWYLFTATWKLNTVRAVQRNKVGIDTLVDSGHR